MIWGRLVLLFFPGYDLCDQHVERCIASGNLKFPTIIKMRLCLQ